MDRIHEEGDGGVFEEGDVVVGDGGEGDDVGMVEGELQTPLYHSRHHLLLPLHVVLDVRSVPETTACQLHLSYYHLRVVCVCVCCACCACFVCLMCFLCAFCVLFVLLFVHFEVEGLPKQTAGFRDIVIFSQVFA